MKKLTWQKIQPFHAHKPTERWGHSSCVIGSDLVVFGGYADSYYMNDMWTFSTLTLQWKYHETTGTIPEPRSNATLNYDKQHNRLILFGGGGQGKKRFNCIYALDLDTKKWIELEPKNNQNKPWQRTYHVSQIIDKYLVIFGGENFADLNDIWLFDLEQKLWHEVKIPTDAPRPSPRRFHSAVLRNNQLIIIGGCHGKYRSLKDAYKMNFNEFLVTKDISMLSWKQIIIESSDFIPRWGHSSSYNALNDKIYIFGGRFSNDLQDIIILDLDLRTSKKVYVNSEETPCPRRKHSANFIGCSLLVFGGFNGNYFNDLYSICIPLETSIPKFTKDFVIPFSEFLKKQHNDTVSFLRRYIEKIQNFIDELSQKYHENVIDELLSSIVRGYFLFSDRYTSELQYLQEKYQIQSKIYSSKHHKIEYVRSEYTMCHVLQEKTASSKGIKSQNVYGQKSNTKQENTFSSNNFKLFPPHDISSEIVLINQMDFYHYMQDHNKVCVQKENKRFYRYLDNFENNKQKLCIEFNGIGRFTVDPVIKFTNQYFYHSFKQNSIIYFENITLQNLKIFQVGLMFLETNILVVPKNFSFQQWKGLAEFANYFCVENLLQIVEKFFIAKIDFTNITELSMISCDFRMNNLMHKCAQMIIQREEHKFFLEKNQTRKITPDLFQQFERKFFERLENFFYPEEFQRQLTKQFQINKLNIFLRNIVKIRQHNSHMKNKICQQNEEKENEQNLILIR